MIQIEIANGTVNERHGTSNKGKAYRIREQQGYARVLDENGKPGRYPVQCVIGLGDDQHPYPVGLYNLDPRSIYVGRFGRLEIGTVRLQPVQPQGQK